jgi:SAM-dependent methyltransferase
MELEGMELVKLLTVGAVAGLACFGFSGRPLRFGLGLGALLLAGAFVSRDADTLLVERSFFGVHRIEHAAGGYHLLSHGSTLHGAQSLDPERRLEPLTYYHREGPVGQMFSDLPLPVGGRRVAVVGLGTGSIACYGRAGERWTYYEIDPVVERIARDRRYFTFLSDCPVEVEVVLGDARLTLSRATASGYDLIVLDAFSSDAIPIHLVTREALGEYLGKLAPGGAIAFHISNRHLDLEPVLARLARDAGLVGRLRRDRPGADRERYHVPADWLVLAREEADLGGLAADERWKPLAERPKVGLWTDDYSNILSILRSKK